MKNRILIISHNVLGNNTNMGRTLCTQFSCFKDSEIAQIYFSQELPSDARFQFVKYFQMTDENAFKSFIKKNDFGQTIVPASVNQLTRDKKRKGVGAFIKKKILAFFRTRTPITCLIRNFVWKHSKWNNKTLLNFLNEYNPEVVFFASGEHSFSYEIALFIAKTYNIPLVIGCYDDFYLRRKSTISPFYFLNRHLFMKIVEETFDYASCFTSLCDSMTEAYENRFGKKGFTIHNSYSVLCNSVSNDIRDYGIIYAGNLGLGRAEILIKLGKIIHKHSELGFHRIVVFSNEIRKRILGKLKWSKGIEFKGSLDYNKLNTIIRSAKFQLHVESFKCKNVDRIKYSISTKIPDALVNQVPLIAVGPSNVASIKYLRDTESAYCITDIKNLERDFLNALSYSNYREILQNAELTAKTNHEANLNSIKLFKVLHSVVLSNNPINKN